MIASSSWTSISFHLHGREETRESGGEINEKWRREWKEEGARGYPIRLEGKGERREERREFPSKRATVVFGSLERGSHDDLLYIAPNSNSNLLLLLLLSQKNKLSSPAAGSYIGADLIDALR
jgi:hypothetical protein